ncbi:MAG: M28 family peptidase, partial [Planctomycetota bacterium]
MLSALMFVLVAAPPAAPQSPTAVASDPAIRAADITAHVRALAADELAGRATGSPGAQLAARYLADALAAAGVEPAGDRLADGKRGYLQDAAIVRRAWKAAPVLAFVAKSGERLPAAWGTDYELDDARAFRGRVELVVGSAAGATLAADAKERGVVWEGGSRTQREAWLAEQGRADGRGLDALVLIGGKKSGTARSELPSPRLSRASADGAPAPIVVRLRGELGARAAAGELAALELELVLDEERGGAANVVGRLPARGARQLPGAIVLSAHYDHLGTREPREPRAPTAAGAAAEGPASAPDAIYNGADDDASGCAAVLELAAALAPRA